MIDARSHTPCLIAPRSMSKVNAIYSALDNGNPKSALKLCQQALTKSPAGTPGTQLLKALMALSYSRLDLSNGAMEICAALIDEGVSDLTVVDTLGYVYRREHRFDLLSKLLSSPAVLANDPSVETCQQAFTTGVQSGHYDALATIALKLVKLSGEKKYYGWYAFGMSLRAGDDKSLSLALAMLDKLGPDSASPGNQSRSTTCGRMSAYIGLFKVQLLAKMGKWTEAMAVIEAIKSGLVTDEEKQTLIDDIQLMQGECGAIAKSSTRSLVSSTDKVSPRHTNLIDQLEAVIVADSWIEARGQDGWGSESNRHAFVSLLKQHITQSFTRSDCIVTTAPFLALLVRDDVQDVADHVNVILEPLYESELDAKRATGMVSLHKLMYGLDKSRIDIARLLTLAMTLVSQEAVLDECSPGKQLLLLSSILVLEDIDSFSSVVTALSILEFGSRTFTHCSHSRLIECIAYARLGLATRAVERFQALGVKNAQWRNLWWLISGCVNRFHVASKEDLLSEILYFFRRNKVEMTNNLALIVEESMFFVFDHFKLDLTQADTESAVKAFVDREEVWARMLNGELIDDMDQLEVPKTSEDNDYAPLLFITIPKLGSKSTVQVRTELARNRLLNVSACGFRWPADLVRAAVPPATTGRTSPLSEDLVIGKLIQPVAEEGAEYQSIRLCFAGIVNSILASEWDDVCGRLSALELPSTATGAQFQWHTSTAADYSWYRVLHMLALLVTKPKLGQVEESEFDAAVSSICAHMDILFDALVECDGFQTFAPSGSLLNGPLGAVIAVTDKVGNEYSKKSHERKHLKRVIQTVKSGCDRVIESLDAKSIGPIGDEARVVLPAALAENRKAFIARFESDFKMEIDSLREGMRGLLDRTRLVKL